MWWPPMQKKKKKPCESRTRDKRHDQLLVRNPDDEVDLPLVEKDYQCKSERDQPE